MTAPPAHPASAPPPHARRVIAAGFLGTTIGYYDFSSYGTAAALVSPAVFFPALGESAATSASFATSVLLPETRGRSLQATSAAEDGIERSEARAL